MADGGSAGGYDFGVGISSSSPSAAHQSSPYIINGGGGGVGTTNPNIVQYVVMGAVGLGMILLMLVFFRH